jgi:hypothetical protein
MSVSQSKQIYLHDGIRDFLSDLGITASLGQPSDLNERHLSILNGLL